MANEQNIGGSQQGGQQGQQQQGKQQQGQQQGQQQAQGQSGSQGGSQSTYWRQQFQNEPYYQAGRQFEEYEPAYRLGEQGRSQYGGSGRSFQDAEQNLRSDYEQQTQGKQNVLGWDQGASQASRAAWERAGLHAAGDRDIQSQGDMESGNQGGMQGGSQQGGTQGSSQDQGRRS